MKGILVHSTTRGNIESILINGALYDSSKTEPEFDKGEGLLCTEGRSRWTLRHILLW